MDEVKISLEAHKKLQTTPFYHCVRVPTIVIDSYLLVNPCGKYQGDEKFVIGGKELRCTDEDFG